MPSIGIFLVRWSLGYVVEVCESWFFCTYLGSQRGLYFGQWRVYPWEPSVLRWGHGLVYSIQIVFHSAVPRGPWSAWFEISEVMARIGYEIRTGRKIERRINHKSWYDNLQLSSYVVNGHYMSPKPEHFWMSSEHFYMQYMVITSLNSPNTSEHLPNTFICNTWSLQVSKARTLSYFFLAASHCRFNTKKEIIHAHETEKRSGHALPRTLNDRYEWP